MVSIPVQRALVLILTVSCLSACAGYTQRSEAYLRPYRQGEVNEAAETASSVAKQNEGSRDEVLLRLEQGRLLRAAGHYAKSNQALNKAERLMRQYASEAKVKLLDETGAIVTNLRALPYRGRSYDRILANTYKALNYMHLGQFDQARIELNRAYEAQQLAVAKNKARIAEAKNQARADSQHSDVGGVIDVSKTLDSEQFQTQVHSRYQSLGDLEAYADYVNPYTEFLEGLYLICRGSSASDYEQGLTSLKRLVAMTDNPYVERDIEIARRVVNGSRMPPRTYVIFETGLAPKRKQIRIDLPLFLVNGEVDYFGAAFPMLRYDQAYVHSLEVSHGGKQAATKMLADLDSVIGRDFQNTLSLIITKTLMASAVKAATAYALNEATEDADPYANLATRLGATLYQAAMNQADLRTWRTLPKQVQYCSFPTPKSGKVKISLPASSQTVRVKAGHVNVVTVNSPSPNRKPIVSQFTLR